MVPTDDSQQSQTVSSRTSWGAAFYARLTGSLSLQLLQHCNSTRAWVKSGILGCFFYVVMFITVNTIQKCSNSILDTNIKHNISLVFYLENWMDQKIQTCTWIDKGLPHSSEQFESTSSSHIQWFKTSWTLFHCFQWVMQLKRLLKHLVQLFTTRITLKIYKFLQGWISQIKV